MRECPLFSASSLTFQAFTAWALLAFSACGTGLDTTFVVTMPELEVKDGLKVWYRASAFLPTYSFGALMSGGSWAPQEGYGQTLTASGTNLYFQGYNGGTSSPSWQAASLSGAATKFWSAANSIGTHSAYSLYVAGRFFTSGAEGVGFSSGSNFTCGPIDQVALFSESGTGYWRADLCKNGYPTAVTASVNGGGQSMSARVFRVRWSESDQMLRLFVSGWPEAATSTSSVGSSTMTFNGTMSIGSLQGILDNAGFEIHEVLFYDSILDSSDDESVREYLRKRHPVDQN